jgi:hypothetical protein
VDDGRLAGLVAHLLPRLQNRGPVAEERGPDESAGLRVPHGLEDRVVLGDGDRQAARRVVRHELEQRVEVLHREFLLAGTGSDEAG